MFNIKTFIKRTCIALCAAISISGLAACSQQQGGGTNVSSEPVDITIWHYFNGAQGEAFEALVDEFNSTDGNDQNIHVTSVSKGSVDDLIAALDEASSKAAGAEEMPDIYQCYLDMARSLDDSGYMADLSYYLSDEEIDEFIPAFMDEGRFSGDGSIKLFPIAKSTEVLMLNATDWEDFADSTGADVSKLSTWEGIAAIAEDYYNETGKSFFGRDSFANYVLVGSSQLGHDIFNVKDGKMTLDLDKSAFRRMWDCYYIPFIKGYFGQKGRYRSDDIKTGDLIAQVTAISSAAYFSDAVVLEDGSSYSIDHMVLPPPDFEGTGPYTVQQGASMAVAPSDESREKAAVSFLKWFTQSERNIKFAADVGYLPVHRDACTIEAFEEYKKQNNLTHSPQVDAIEVAIENISACKLYTMPVFEGATAARNTLGYSMIDRAVEDRERVLYEIGEGASFEDAIYPFVSDENFESWFNELKEQLSEFENK